MRGTQGSTSRPSITSPSAEAGEDRARQTQDAVRQRVAGQTDHLQRLFGARSALSGGKMRAPISGM